MWCWRQNRRRFTETRCERKHESSCMWTNFRKFSKHRLTLHWVTQLLQPCNPIAVNCSLWVPHVLIVTLILYCSWQLQFSTLWYNIYLEWIYKSLAIITCDFYKNYSRQQFWRGEPRRKKKCLTVNSIWIACVQHWTSFN